MCKWEHWTEFVTLGRVKMLLHYLKLQQSVRDRCNYLFTWAVESMIPCTYGGFSLFLFCLLLSSSTTNSPSFPSTIPATRFSQTISSYTQTSVVREQQRVMIRKYCFAYILIDMVFQFPTFSFSAQQSYVFLHRHGCCILGCVICWPSCSWCEETKQGDRSLLLVWCIRVWR